MNHFKKYLVAFFLTAIFLLQEAGSHIPSLFIKDKEAAAALMADAEQEKNKETSEEKSSERVKEPYWHHTALNLCPVFHIKGGSKISATDFIYKTAVCISIPTPPPEAA